MRTTARPEWRAAGTSKLLEMERAKRAYKRQQRLKLGEQMATKKMSVEDLVRDWNKFKDGAEIEVRSSPKLWDFLASKRHPSQRQLKQENLRRIEMSLSSEGFDKSCSSDAILVEKESRLVISWQHRTEVFRRADPNVDVRVLFGATLGAMAKAPEPWSKSEIANLSMSSDLEDGEAIGPNDMAIASACEMIIFSRVPSNAEAHVANAKKWLNEIRIARRLSFKTRNHGSALRPASTRASVALAFSRFGDAKMDRCYKAIIEEEAIATVSGFFSLLERWNRHRNVGEERRHGAACLRGFASWISGHPVKSWRVFPGNGPGSIDENDERTRNDWREWKNAQRRNGGK